jgi:secondary thiamine-phosphate synthase enzyme
MATIVPSDTQREIRVRTPGRALVDVTREVEAVVAASGLRTGLCVVFCRHTSASLLIQENADPSARRDLLAWLERLAPDGDPRYEHDAEGPDDMPSHLRSAVTRTSETIPVTDGRLALGRWQGIFLVEHRREGHERRLVVHVTGRA